MATHSSVLAYGGAWWVSVSGVAQSRTRLKRLSSSSSSRLYYMLYNMLCQYVSVSFLIPNLIVYQNHLEILARNILPGPPTKRSDSVSLEWDLETLSWVHYVLILPMSTWWWYGYFKTKTKCSKFSNIKNISFYNIKKSPSLVIPPISSEEPVIWGKLSNSMPHASLPHENIDWQLFPRFH